MKTALYFENKEAQLVLTAENNWEKTILKMVHESYPDETMKGGFYECQGGWIRHNPVYNDEIDDSLMFRMPKTPKSSVHFLDS